MKKTRRLSRDYQRGATRTPPLSPPPLQCPVCLQRLIYCVSVLGGASIKHAEQWDYFECPNGCSFYQYRHRTQTVRPVNDAGFPRVLPPTGAA